MNNQRGRDALADVYDAINVYVKTLPEAPTGAAADALHNMTRGLRTLAIREGALGLADIVDLFQRIHGL